MTTPADLEQTALALAAGGLSLLPVDARDKRPYSAALPRYCPWPRDDTIDNDRGKPTWRPFQTVRAPGPLISGWIRDGAQIATATGPISGGLLIIDVDEPPFYPLLMDAIGPIALGLPVQQTGGGGYQIALRCPNPGHNDKLAYVPDASKLEGRRIAIETRAEGGYAVVYPSLHPSGQRYRLLQGDWAKIPYLPQEQADRIISICRSFCQAPFTTQQLEAMQQAQNAPPRLHANGSANVIDQYNATTKIEDELTRQGYTHCYGPRWAPPGAGKRDSVIVQNGRAFHHDSNFPLSDGYWHNAFDLFLCYEHRGDMKSAVRAAATLLCLPSLSPAPKPVPSPPPAPIAQPSAPVDINTPPPAPDEATIRQCLNQDEVGDAYLLHALYGQRLAFDHSIDQWFFWGGHAWAQDSTDQIRYIITAHVGGCYLGLAAQVNARAATELDVDARDRLLKFAATLQARARALHKLKRLNSVATLAQHLFGITGDQWDAQPYLLAVQNGVIDLKTGALIPGEPGQYLRKVAPTAWQDLHTPALRWEQFLAELFEPGTEHAEIPAYLQRLFGYGMLGVVREHVLPVLFGPQGRNGKGTILKAIRQALGSHAGAISNDVLIATGRPRDAGSPSAHLMDLQGKRMVWASESDEGQKFNVAQAKLLSGGDEINARPPHGRCNITFQPSHLLLLLTNHKPKATSDDDAFWARMQLIPFTLRFLAPDKLTGAANERPADPNLDDKLRAEAPGILAWLVRGCLEYQQMGIQPPAIVQMATDAYRDDEDTFGDYVDECLHMNPMKTTPTSLAYKRYQLWAADMGYRNPMNVKTFSKRMKERFTVQHTNTGNVYLGCEVMLPSLLDSV